MRQIRRPTRLDRARPHPPAQGDIDGKSIEILPSEAVGEFDTPRADPRYPEWTCANLAEAFPGPMTPLSLELVRDVMFTGADQVALLLPLDESIRDNVQRRQLAVFGHRLYQNVSVLREMASAMPGQTPEDFDHQINGRPYPEGYVRPRPTVRDVPRYAKFAVTAGPRLAGIGRAVAAVERRAEEMSCPVVVDLSNQRLRARIDMLWGDCVEGWKVGLLCTFLVGVPAAMLQRRYGADALTGFAGDLASSRLLSGVRELAAYGRGRPAVAAILGGCVDTESWTQLQDADPEFARRLRLLLDEAGHRGPGEAELANAVYADAPWLLLRAIAGARDVTPEKPAVKRRDDVVGRRLARVSWSMIARRERCRDAVMRLTNDLRGALREWGARLTADGSLASSDDVFYLTHDELFTPRTDRGALVARRRAERERLAGMDLPLRFTQPMTLATTADGLGSPAVITGMPAVSGIVVGRVRVMRSPDDEMEPGEVLVTRVTDTGWTPFFATAAAIVTDVGGAMSHAAIVAREFGIPAVVGTEDASRVLADGQLVEVNGTTGVVTVLD
jgi:phosphohistidine swiveling domain-containing protein